MNPKNKVAKLLASATKLPTKQVASTLEVPSNSKLGDLAFPCFMLSKQYKRAPAKIAEELASKLNSKDLEVKAAGPYVNFFFNKGKFVQDTVKTVLKQKSSYADAVLGRGKKAMVEFASPNTNKPLHFGHLRNMSIGESTSRILEKAGYDVIRVNLNNDRGISVCKSMLAYQKWGRNRKPSTKPDHFVGDFYIMFSNKAKQNPELEQEAREMLRKWEADDKSTLALWKRMSGWALKGYEQTYKRFGIKFDKQYYESQMYKEGKDMVLAGLGKGLFYEDETGATLIDLSNEGLDSKVLVRADGTAVYVTQDLYLAQLKYKDYNIDKSIHVVGSEQNYHFKVLFKVLDLLRPLGYKFAKENYHLSHGMVHLPSGRMKSREGTTVDADELIDKLEALASTEIKKRHKTPSKKLASKIGGGAIKYFLLKYDARKDFTFDPKKSISFEGDTGPYLQYALVRARQIMKKVGSVSISLDALLDAPQEFELAKTLASYPEVVVEAAENYAPHKVANYAYKLCRQFSSFYEACPVLRAESEAVKAARLGLVKAFAQTLEDALGLLGIEQVGQM